MLTGTLPPLVDGDEGQAWASEHDRIDYGLLDRTLAGVPAGAAAQVRDACARWRRLRFAIDATPYPRPDAECSPGRGHVHHDACRCDGTRKTVPGWEYQFVAALGHLRTAWAALIDVERTTPASRTAQTIRQVKNLLRRLTISEVGSGAGAVALSGVRSRSHFSPGFPCGPLRCVTMAGCSVSSPRRIEPCVRFSRTRLTDAVHRRHSA